MPTIPTDEKTAETRDPSPDGIAGRPGASHGASPHCAVGVGPHRADERLGVQQREVSVPRNLRAP